MIRSMFLFAWLLLLPSQSQAQSFQPFVQYVESLNSPADKKIAVDSFLQLIEPEGIPWREKDNLVHFFYRGTAGSVAMAGDVNLWDPSTHPLVRLPDTDLWYLSLNLPSDTRVDYKLVIDENWILDPLNPNIRLAGFGPNSELAMPRYSPPWETENHQVKSAGSLTEDSLYSSNTDRTYAYRVYLPAGYHEQSDLSYPTIYVHDGWEYLELADAQTILDNLIANEMIQPLIAVFIQPTDRNEEYAGTLRSAYPNFLTEELVPKIEQEFRARAEPASRATIGTSYGGNISGLISFYHPEVFGKAGLHSAAFWPNEYETAHLWTDSEYRKVELAFVWGSYEGSLHTNLLEILPVLAAKGNLVYARHYPEGHSWGLWRATLDDLLMALFPIEGKYSIAPEKMAWNMEVVPGTDQIRIWAPDHAAQPLRLSWMDIHGALINTQTLNSGDWVTIPEDIPGGICFLQLHAEELPLGIRRMVIEK